MYRVAHGTGVRLSGGHDHASLAAQEQPPPSPEWYHPVKRTSRQTH